MTKHCPRCETTKPLTDFSKQKGKNGVQSYCRSCQSEYQAERKVRLKWEKEHPEEAKQNRIRRKLEFIEKKAVRNRETQRQRRAENPGCDRETEQKYYRSQKRKISHLKRNLRVNYGLTLEEFQEMSERQGHACAICKTKEPTGRSDRLSVDHDHDTGIVRALLCSTCNLRLGVVEEWSRNGLLQVALAYLQQHRYPKCA